MDSEERDLALIATPLPMSSRAAVPSLPENPAVDVRSDDPVLEPRGDEPGVRADGDCSPIENPR